MNLFENGYLEDLLKHGPVPLLSFSSQFQNIPITLSDFYLITLESDLIIK